jgi:hypothetical protein
MANLMRVPTLRKFMLPVAVTIAAGLLLAANPQSSNVVSMPSVSALRAGNYSAYKSMYLSGYYSASTQGGGPLTLDASDTTTADNGCTVFVDAHGNRFKRQVSGPVNVQECGAKGDGTTDDTAAFNAAIAAAKAQNSLAVAQGSIYAPNPVSAYKINGPVTFTGAVSYMADSNSPIDCKGATGDCFRINSSSADAHFDNISIFPPTGQNTNAGFIGVNINTATGGISLNNLHIYANATLGKCLSLTNSFEIHFTGETVVRNCGGGAIVGENSGSIGNNVITFDQLLVIEDPGYSLARAPVSICNGNGWKLPSGEILNNADDTVPFVDIGNCHLVTGDIAPLDITVSLQLEGKASYGFRVGAGTYDTSAQYPRDVRILNPYVTASGITGDVINLKYVQGSYIQVNTWPAVVGGDDFNADNTNDQLSFVGTNFTGTIAATNACLLINNGPQCATFAGVITNTCAGTVTLSGGTGTVTNSCITGLRPVLCTDNSGNNSVGCNPASGSMAVTGNGTDIISWAQF